MLHEVSRSIFILKNNHCVATAKNVIGRKGAIPGNYPFFLRTAIYGKPLIAKPATIIIWCKPACHKSLRLKRGSEEEECN